MLKWAIFKFFLTVFFVFFMFTIYGIPVIEGRKKKEESSHRPATRIFVRKYKHNSVYVFQFKIYFFLWLAYLKINS